METKGIGLDIGSSAVRAAEIGLERGQCHLRRYAQVGLPTGAVVDGEVVNPGIVAEALRRLWDEGGFSTRKVVLGVSGHRLIVRQADVPALNEEDLRSSLRFDAQELIPIPMEDAYFDFQILERTEGTDADGRATMRILIVAAHREMIRAHLSALEGAGLEAVAIDASPLALMRVVPPSGPDGGAEAIVSIGGELTTVAVRQGGIPRFIRSLAMGGSKVTVGIANALHVDAAVAESLKRGVAPEAAPQLAQANRAISAELRDLGEDVRATIDFFLSQADGGRIDRLLVTGGASMTAGLVEELAGNTDVEIRRIDPFANLVLDNLGLDEQSLRRARASAATAVGLGLWTADAPQRRLSVLPGDMAEARRRRRLAMLAGVAVAGVAGVLVFVGAAEAVAVHLERTRVHEAQAQATALQAKVNKLQIETAIHTKVAQRAHLEKAALKGDVNWVQVINSIEAATPAGLQLQSFSGGTGGSASATASASTGSLAFSVKGTGGLPVVAAWLDGLQKDPNLKGTWVTGIAVTTNGGAVSFSSTTSMTPQALSNRDKEVTP